MDDSLIDIEENFISDQEIIDKFADKELILFGPGEVGAMFLRKLLGLVKVKCFVISGVEADAFEPLQGIPIYNINKLNEIRTDEPIIITSGWHYKVMAQQLLNAGYAFGKDFFIYGLYHPQKKEHIERFIEHNKAVWKDYAPNKILLYRYLTHSAPLIDISYFVNYLAQKHKAEIWSFGKKTNYYTQSIDRVYSSFNVNNQLFSDELSEDQIKRVNELLQNMWSRLNTKQDWLNIIVDGIDFGEDICSYYEFGRTVISVKPATVIKFSAGKTACL